MKKISEMILGYLMGIGAFWILPVSIELIGVIPAFLSVIVGAFFVFLLKKIIGDSGWLLILFCGVILAVYHFLSFPFCSSVSNGLYSAMVAGILLSVQIDFLSLDSKDNISFKKSGVWYLSGLLLGILLK